ncbi:MAG: glutamate-1-semialdehyde 2,1-aminomutase, partial [Dehalococcoidia bacterium]|nr:glutamate-1-semialdehyde 2,1-aminomutase [Dehalococcoidia bacterium]
MAISKKRSARLYREAVKYLPGGVDSPVRAFKAVGGQPLFIQRGQGSRIFDVDGNQFIDYVGSWGPLILGHAHPCVVEAIRTTAQFGTSFGAPTEMETTLARLVRAAMPSMQMVRFVSSGTEATMSALRLARAFTGRDKIVKFNGCYHGHSDGLLVKAGSGVATLALPDSAGVPASYARNTLVAPYNDLASVEKLFTRHGKSIAAIIVEPVAANMGVVPPRSGFLQGLRQVTRDAGALLIFDEVITGFRVAPGGAQALYGVIPDLTCLGKIIGGGLPVGAYGGRKEIMEMLAPIGSVYQAGTLSGNPLAMAVGVETLTALAQEGIYEQLEQRSASLAGGLARMFNESGLDVFLTRVGSVMTVFFTGTEVVDYETAKTSDTALYSRFFNL